MNLASAYPNSALSPVMMTLIAVIATGGLVRWLFLVFRAARPSSPSAARPPSEKLLVLAVQDKSAEDEQGEAGRAAASRPDRAAA
jgi:hypothetical protein